MGYECAVCMETWETPAPSVSSAVPGANQQGSSQNASHTKRAEENSPEYLQRLSATACGHVHHTACLKRWFAQKKKKECPSCQKLLTPKMIIQIRLPSSTGDFLQQDEIDKRSLPQCNCATEECAQLYDNHKTLLSDYEKLEEKSTLLQKIIGESDDKALLVSKLQSLNNECAQLKDSINCKSYEASTMSRRMGLSFKNYLHSPLETQRRIPAASSSSANSSSRFIPESPSLSSSISSLASTCSRPWSNFFKAFNWTPTAQISSPPQTESNADINPTILAMPQEITTSSNFLNSNNIVTAASSKSTHRNPIMPAPATMTSANFGENRVKSIPKVVISPCDSPIDRKLKSRTKRPSVTKRLRYMARKSTSKPPRTRNSSGPDLTFNPDNIRKLQTNKHNLLSLFFNQITHSGVSSSTNPALAVNAASEISSTSFWSRVTSPLAAKTLPSFSAHGLQTLDVSQSSSATVAGKQPAQKLSGSRRCPVYDSDSSEDEEEKRSNRGKRSKIPSLNSEDNSFRGNKREKR